MDGKWSEICAAIRDTESFRSWSTSDDGDIPVMESAPLLSEVTGIIEIAPEDMVVTVRSGTHIGVLQDELSLYGLSLPLSGIGDGEWEHGRHGRLYQLLDMNLPHVLEAQHGTWRDWVLAMKAVMADGSLVKSGAKVVKNVAGYDAHKLFIGARGSLGVIVEVTLKVLPIRSIATPRTTKDAEHSGEVVAFQRVLPSDMAAATAALPSAYMIDEPSCTIWHDTDQITRFKGDWVRDREGLPVDLDETTKRLMLRTKEIFDPTHKLNPGIWGFM